MTLKERFARPGFAVSALVHAGALAATLVAFSSNQHFPDELETVPIAVITDNEFNQIMKGDKAAKEVRPDATAATEHVAAQEASQPPPPPAAAAAPPPPPPPPPDETPPTPPERPVEAAPLPPVPTPPVRDAELTLPKPVPKPVPKPPVATPKPVAFKPPPKPKPPEKPAEKPKPDLLARLMQEQLPDPPPQPSPKVAPPRKPVPDAKPAEQESHFDLTDITKLFTRDAPPQKGSTAHDISRVASLGSPTANAPKMSPSFWAGLDGLMEEQYRKCWSYLGLTTGQKYIPQVRVVYGADGSLQGQPTLINPPSNPAMQSLADSAIRAVRHCNPLKIPDQYAPYYEEWKGRVLRFDPEEMAG